MKINHLPKFMRLWAYCAMLLRNYICISAYNIQNKRKTPISQSLDKLAIKNCVSQLTGQGKKVSTTVLKKDCRLKV